jgi:putative CRISPR-associated protein (TIGR02619 family)
MKKVIIMVGTSLFENYLEEHSNDTNFKNAYNYFKNNKIKANDLDKEWDRKENIKISLRESYFKNNQNASAEIKSLIKLKEELNEELEIYLLYSDTALSRLAAKILYNILSEYNPYDELKDCKIKEPIKIEGLQIWDRSEFNKGMVNLIQTIENISQGYWENVIINITGGYKATIPYLTILAQVNRCPIYYIFEDTDALIKIPYIPIDIKQSIFEKHKELFRKLEREEIPELPQGLSEDERKDIFSLLTQTDNLYALNPLGVILWEKYKKNFEIFYISDLVQHYISQNTQWKIIFEKSAKELKRRYIVNPNHPDLDHTIVGFDNRERFKCFKHKEENLQVRILYKIKEWETRYGSKEFDIYIGNIKIGSDVHNVENEYIKDFKREIEKIRNIDKYKIYEIKKEGQND